MPVSKPFLTFTNHVEFWSESENAVRRYQIFLFPGIGVRVRDVDHDTLHALSDVLDDLNDIVFPTLEAFRADAGWYLVDVLDALGVDLDTPEPEPELELAGSEETAETNSEI